MDVADIFLDKSSAGDAFSDLSFSSNVTTSVGADLSSSQAGHWEMPLALSNRN